MYIVSLSFDDGLEKSNLQIADIYEKFGLSACFNMLAREEVDGEKVDDPYHNWPKGDFKLWNELEARGHEIMPHGLDNEGWGPIRAEYLESLLERLSGTQGVTIRPVGRALSM